MTENTTNKDPQDKRFSTFVAQIFDQLLPGAREALRLHAIFIDVDDYSSKKYGAPEAAFIIKVNAGIAITFTTAQNRRSIMSVFSKDNMEKQAQAYDFIDKGGDYTTDFRQQIEERKDAKDYLKDTGNILNVMGPDIVCEIEVPDDIAHELREVFKRTGFELSEADRNTIEKRLRSFLGLEPEHTQAQVRFTFKIANSPPRYSERIRTF